ncbi:MAG: hypothetical protein ACT6XY_01285 [Phreatobacter sp.]|jgi:hypothetical protein|uniref:hypothetical protein n=1 Tax=Phreatobacter sp. TaxID=1966341 RepID=UPI00403754BB
MTQHDPRDERVPAEPTRLDGGRRPDLDPPTDPRVTRSTSGNWGLIGGLGAVLVLGIVVFSMMGGNPSGQTPMERGQTTAAPSPAPADPSATGSTPRQAP